MRVSFDNTGGHVMLIETFILVTEILQVKKIMIK